MHNTIIKSRKCKADIANVPRAWPNNVHEM